MDGSRRLGYDTGYDRGRGLWGNPAVWRDAWWRGMCRGDGMIADLTLEDVSAVIRLVREVCDRWDDPRGWREHLLNGACRLLGGTVGLMVVDDEPTGDSFGRPSVICAVGIAPEMRGLVQPAFSQFARREFGEVSRNLLPGITELHAQLSRQGWVTAAGSQISDAGSYHASPHYREFRRRLGSDDFVVSMRIVRSEEHTSELQSPCNLVCRLLLEKKNRTELT